MKRVFNPLGGCVLAVASLFAAACKVNTVRYVLGEQGGLEATLLSASFLLAFLFMSYLFGRRGHRKYPVFLLVYLAAIALTLLLFLILRWTARDGLALLTFFIPSYLFGIPLYGLLQWLPQNFMALAAGAGVLVFFALDWLVFRVGLRLHAETEI